MKNRKTNILSKILRLLPLFIILFPVIFCDDASRKTLQNRSQTEELFILWSKSLTNEEAATVLASLNPNLSLLSHDGDFSVCSGSSATASRTLSVLNSSPLILSAEKNAPLTLCVDETNEFYRYQWWLDNTGEYLYDAGVSVLERSSVPDIDINYTEAANLLSKRTDLRSVTVAVLDTGVDYTHPDLAGHMWVNTAEIPDNGIDDDNNGYVDDIYGWDFYNRDNTVCHYSTASDGTVTANDKDNDSHGTHLAGIIAASGKILGVASPIDVKIMSLKTHGGKSGDGTIADAIRAIKYAEQMGAEICNLSWGNTNYSETLETVIRSSHMLFVVSAGNTGSNVNAVPTYPACLGLDNIISVANITPLGRLSETSNYGSSTIDLAAPGTNIYSTAVGGGYRYLSGTSMSAPVVSGVAAMLYACGDHLFPQNIREIILQTVTPVEELNGFVITPGIPNAFAALSAADNLVSDSLPPVLSFETAFRDDTIVLSLLPQDPGGSKVRLTAYTVGRRNLDYFGHGQKGIRISDDRVTFAKAGIYTFYVADYAGNEAVYEYEVLDDTTAPTLSLKALSTDSGIFRVNFLPFDTESGIRSVSYLPGECTLDELQLMGIILSPEDYFAMLPAGRYSLLLTDYRGNKAVYVVELAPNPATRLLVSVAECTLNIGDSYRFSTLVFPADTTDPITYAVNDNGSPMLSLEEETQTVTALVAGDVTLTVQAGTLQRDILFHIKEAAETDEQSLWLH